MFRNYFKIAWRNIIRNKINGFINIAGLAIGMACVILILFYVQDELKYDRFLKQSSHIYQVNLDGKMGGEEGINGNTPPPAGAALVKAFPEIETYTRIYRPGDIVVRYEEEKQTESYFTEKNILAVDSNFLQLFTYPVMEGNPATCLQKPNSIVITEQTAKKYFGKVGVIGKILLFGNERKPCTVTGVLHNIPSQSSLQFDMLAAVSSYPIVKRFNWSWVWMQVSTYVKLYDNAAIDERSIAKLEAKFPSMVKLQAASAFKRIGKPFDEFIKQGGRWDLRLQPLSRIHLYSENIASRLTTLGSIKYVYIFSVIALFIIILACVNFMNLSTAQAAKRAKEVGIRKVLGSVKAQLIKQFLAEAMLNSFIAAIIAVLLVLVFLNPFNEIAGKSFGIHLLFTNNNWIFVLGLTLLTGLLAGSYPAFYLTSFNPAAVLKGIKLFRSDLGTLFIRNGLVVFQFTISTALIICTIVVFKQLELTQSKDLGLNKENIIVITNSNRLGKSEESFRQELTKLPEVISASISSGIPTKENFGDGYIPEPTGANENLVKDIALSSFIIDYDFIPALGIDILKGRNFSKDFSDSASVILNETAAKQIGWKEPVGSYLQYPGNSQRFKVIAVLKDFNTQSLRSLVGPFALFHTSSKTYDVGTSYLIVRVKPGNISNSLAKLESKWKSAAPNTPFDYSFLDSEFDALYRSEKRMGTVFYIFTILSVFVACLGLFGLSVYTAERRTKEIGVRKVLGASVQNLVTLLSKDFIKLVIVSAIIAFPVAWWAMNKWLQDFAYHISIGWMIFVSAGAIALTIALVTVSFHAIKAALANPVKSLRSE
jgi:putative ABC transport system permease protein